MHQKRNRKWHKGWEHPQGWGLPSSGGTGVGVGSGCLSLGQGEGETPHPGTAEGTGHWEHVARDRQLWPQIPGMDGNGRESKHRHRSGGNCHHWSCRVRLLRLGF